MPQTTAAHSWTAPTAFLATGTIQASGTATPDHTATQAAVAVTTQAAAAQADAAARPVAMSSVAAAEPVRDGTVYGSQRPPDDVPPEDPRPPVHAGRMTRLRIGSHTVSATTLAGIGLTASEGGLILGVDQHRAPVVVELFRPVPTRVTLIGGRWAGLFVAFRALAIGSRVTVVTTDPQSWQGFGAQATGQPDRVRVLTAAQPFTLRATAQQPALLIHDLGADGPPAARTTDLDPAGPAATLGRWQARLTILRQLDPTGVTSLRDSDLVLMQRLSTVEATLAANALRLPAATVHSLQSMPPDLLAVVSGGQDRYAWLRPTDVELRSAGPPQR